jgi:hypothetical protein
VPDKALIVHANRAVSGKTSAMAIVVAAGAAGSKPCAASVLPAAADAAD